MRNSARFFNAFSTRFPIANPHHPYIEISPDLLQLNLPFKNIGKKTLSKITSSISTEFSLFYSPASVELKKKEIIIKGLCDIAIETKKLIAQLQKEDPSFFERLQQFQDKTENEEVSSNDTAEVFSSPAAAQYFFYQGMRSEGVQHTIEMPLKALKTQRIITPDELTKLITHVWITTSARRAKEQQQALKASQEPTLIPYVFKP